RSSRRTALTAFLPGWRGVAVSLMVSMGFLGKGHWPRANGEWLLDEQRRDRLVGVDAADGVGEEGGDGDHLDLRARPLQRDGVGDDEAAEAGGLDAVVGRPRQQ